MGLFDKKFCDICGNKIGLLGNRKLEDGNCCKDCAKKLSPWFDERRHSTVAQIKEQLAYREANKADVAAFRSTRTFGESFTVLHIDENARKFLAAESTNYVDENPDVVSFSQVTGVSLDVQDHRRELKQKDSQGNQVSYNPPRYEYDYEFYLVIRVNHPWFDEMRFKLNRNTLTIQEIGAVRTGAFSQQRGAAFDPRMSFDYQKYENMAREIEGILLGHTAQQPNVSQLFADAAAAAAAQLGAQSQAAQAQVTNAFDPLRVDVQNPNYVQAQQSSDVWACPSCGTQNTGRFCVNCGTTKPARSVRCDKCGWVPQDPNNIPKFCPNCGDPIDANDIV